MEILELQLLLKGKNIKIRNAEPEDAVNIIEHINIVDKETIFLAREPGEFNVTIEKEVELIKHKKKCPYSIFLIAEIEDEIVGTCSLNGYSRKRFSHSAEIAIAIRKKYWGNGIGKQMMEQAINWGKENNIERITLEVDIKNIRAINMYINLGFNIEGKLENNTKLADGTYRSSYIMALLMV